MRLRKDRNDTPARPSVPPDACAAVHEAKQKKRSALLMVILVPVIGFAVIFGIILLSIYLPPSPFDPAMEQVIREHLDKPDGVPLNRTELKTISYLDASGRGVKDLRGMQQLPQLRVLIIRDNPITSLEPLKTLPVLGYVDVRGCPIEDFTPIKDVKYLFRDE